MISPTMAALHLALALAPPGVERVARADVEPRVAASRATVATMVAEGAARADARTATVEIVERATGTPPRTARYVLTLDEEGRTTRLESDDPDGRVSLELSGSVQPDGRVLVRLGLDRVRTLGHARQRTTASLAGRVTMGRRVLLGRVEGHASPSLDILITLR